MDNTDLQLVVNHTGRGGVRKEDAEKMFADGLRQEHLNQANERGITSVDILSLHQKYSGDGNGQVFMSILADIIKVTKPNTKFRGP